MKQQTMIKVSDGIDHTVKVEINDFDVVIYISEHQLIVISDDDILEIAEIIKGKKEREKYKNLRDKIEKDKKKFKNFVEAQ